MSTKKPSIIFRENGLIKIIANNTKNIFIFDDVPEIFKKLNGKGFWENSNGYLMCYISNKSTHLQHYFAHYFVLPRPENFPYVQVDHINRNPKDNRRCNLRYLTASENTFNRKIQPSPESKIRGIRWHKIAKKWQARITKNGKEIYLGLYERLEDAVKVRKQAEKELYNGILFEDRNDF